MAPIPPSRRGQAIDTAAELAAARTTVEIAADAFAVAILNDDPWIVDLPETELARLNSDIEALERTILRVLSETFPSHRATDPASRTTGAVCVPGAAAAAHVGDARHAAVHVCAIPSPGRAAA